MVKNWSLVARQSISELPLIALCRSKSLALCYYVSEYCFPVWSQSHHWLHKGHLDGSLTSSMRHRACTHKKRPKHLGAPQTFTTIFKHTHYWTTDWKVEMLSTRMHSLANEINSPSPKSSADTTWKSRWDESNYRLKQFIPQPSDKPPGHDLNRRNWVLLNRIHSGYGRYASFMHKVELSTLRLQINVPGRLLIFRFFSDHLFFFYLFFIFWSLVISLKINSL